MSGYPIQEEEGFTLMEYPVHKAKKRPRLEGEWQGADWRRASVLEIASFRPESSDHRPWTQAKLLYDHEGLYGHFQVQDRYVRCVRTGFQEPVYRDSCVEIFVQPGGDGGYFNFEFNCGGALLASYITDHTRTKAGFKAFSPLSADEGRRVVIYHSLPSRVDPEIEEETPWRLAFFLPFDLLEKYTGPLMPLEGKRWRANLYKCADESSHPHWASWAPVDSLNFHLPHCFGTLRFL
jgi:hypothetical protein